MQGYVGGAEERSAAWRGGYGSLNHRVLADVGGYERLGYLLLVDAPHLRPARRPPHGAQGTDKDPARHLT